MLGKHRGRGVVAVDMSEAGGTLGIRAARTAPIEVTVTATPDRGNARSYKLDRDNALSPVPGLPGVLR